MASDIGSTLYVVVDSELIGARLVSEAFPRTEYNVAHRKHHYELSSGIEICYGWTKREALKALIAVANERGWRVLKAVN